MGFTKGLVPIFVWCIITYTVYIQSGQTPNRDTNSLFIYTEYRERNIYNNKKKNKIGKCGPCPAFASYTLAFALQLRKKHGKTSVRVAEKCPDIQAAVVQYTFTHKQYTKHHHETEYVVHSSEHT
jgi:hypothetical protein